MKALLAAIAIGASTAASGAPRCPSPAEWAFVAGRASYGEQARFQTWSGSTAQAITNGLSDLAGKARIPGVEMLLSVTSGGRVAVGIVRGGASCINIKMELDLYRRAVAQVAGVAG